MDGGVEGSGWRFGKGGRGWMEMWYRWKEMNRGVEGGGKELMVMWFGWKGVDGDVEGVRWRGGSGWMEMWKGLDGGVERVRWRCG